MSTSSKWQIGTDLVLDVPERTLSCADQGISLPPRAFDLLVRLVEANGRLVTKEQLLEEVWQDRLVEEGTLARHIWLLRKALGDAAELLETVPKSGYRLHAARPFEAKGPDDPASVSVRGRSSAGAPAVVAIVLVVFLAGWLATRADHRQSPMESTLSARAEQAQLLGLRAGSLIARRGESDLMSAVQLYRQAIELAPDSADLHAGLATGLALLSGVSLPASAYESARNEATHALELAPENVDATAVLGLIAMNRDRDWPVAEAAFRRALAIAPDHARSHHWLGELLVLVGERQAEGLAELQRAHQLAPTEVAIASDLAKAAYFSRRYEEAIAAATRAIELDPTFAHSHRWRALALVETDHCDQALDDARDAVRLDQSIIVRAEQIYLLGRCQGTEAASQLAAAIEAEASAGYVSPIALLLIRLGTGQPEAALDALQQAVDSGNMVLGVATAPSLDAIRVEPRFVAILAKLRSSQSDVNTR